MFANGHVLGRKLLKWRLLKGVRSRRRLCASNSPSRSSLHHSHQPLAPVINMSATTLLLFGDQTGEPLPTILRLSRLSSASQSLSSFLRKATEGLQHAIFRIPADERKEFPSFNSPLELASALSKQDQPNAALSAALLCIAQVGDVIL